MGSRSARQAVIFQAIADPTRRALLDRLARQGECPVKVLVAPFAMSQPAVSQHLRILRDAGLVKFRRDGRLHLYRVDAVALKCVYDWVAHYERFWTSKLDALGTYLQGKRVEYGDD